MCNPRRVTITATRELAEAWRQEVSRTVELTGRVAGEARVHQPGHVGLDGEGDVVGLLAGLDGAALVARGAERGLEGDPGPGPRPGELGDDLVVDDLRRRVGHQ